MRQPERADDADTPLRLCYTGPAPARERQEEIERRFGLRIVVGYAMSEIAVRADLAARHPPVRHPRRGPPAPGARRRQRGARGRRRRRRDLGPGETGELLLRNPAVTPGYWQMPEETAEAIVGRLAAHRRPGHRGRRRHLHLRRRGRRRCSAAGARTCRPLEVEEVLVAHPDVLECAVVGVPSELSEEEVKAFVVAGARARSSTSPSCARGPAGRLAAFKVPAVLAAPRRAAAHADGAGGQAPAAVRASREYERARDSRTGEDQRERLPRRRSAPRTPTSISLLGQDLAADLLGQVGFGELAFWLVALRRPDAGELRVFEAVLVALADHGLTPSAIAARLTLTGAPESVQGALAAGLLGGGSRFLGVTEDCGRFLADALAARAAACRPRAVPADRRGLRRRWRGTPCGPPSRPAARAWPRSPRAQGRATRARRSCSRIARAGGPAGPAPAAVRGGRPCPPRDPRPYPAAQRRRRLRCRACRPRLPRRDPARLRPARPLRRGCSVTSPRSSAARSGLTSTATSTRPPATKPPDPSHPIAAYVRLVYTTRTYAAIGMRKNRLRKRSATADRRAPCRRWRGRTSSAPCSPRRTR